MEKLIDICQNSWLPLLAVLGVFCLGFSLMFCALLEWRADRKVKQRHRDTAMFLQMDNTAPATLSSIKKSVPMDKAS